MNIVASVLEVSAATRLGISSLPERRGTALVALAGFAGVVLVLTGMLSIREGFAKTMRGNGRADNVIVLRGGASSELGSGITLEESRTIGAGTGVAQDAAGPIASPELLVIMDVRKRSNGNDANVPLRGVTERAYAVRGNLRIVAGRAFEPGRNELVVGIGAVGQFAGLDVGDTVRSGSVSWTVVGHMAADGGLEESELWADAKMVQQAYSRGNSYQAIYARLESEKAFDAFKDSLTSNPTLNIQAQRQDEYLRAQTQAMNIFITIAGTTVASLMALGAIFGALNSMYTAVASRSREIATLRALGFGRWAVFVSVLVESALLGVAGGLLGVALAWLAFNGYEASTLNFAGSFTQVSFAFAVTPELFAQGIRWALVLGLLGGALPAWHAARQPITTGLRDL